MTGTTPASPPRPYVVSAIDRLHRRVLQLPYPVWTFYLGAGAVLTVVQLLLLWAEGAGEGAALVPVVIFNSLFVPFLLALMQYLDQQAARSLDSMKHLMDMTLPDLERYRYMLSNMPARGALVAGLAAVLFVVMVERLWIVPDRYAMLGQLSFFNICFQLVDKGSAFVFGVFVYHTVRQLRMVNTVALNHVGINLFDLTPLQAFSRVTASTAIGLVAGVYGWLLINPELLSDPLILFFAGTMTLLAMAVFVLPLMGVHQLMEKEKSRRLMALDAAFEALFAQFDEALAKNDHEVTARLNGTIASLEIQRKRIAAIPTWPWKPETAQFTLTAVTLPLILAVLQFIAEQAFAW